MTWLGGQRSEFEDVTLRTMPGIYQHFISIRFSNVQ